MVCVLNSLPSVARIIVMIVDYDIMYELANLVKALVITNHTCWHQVHTSYRLMVRGGYFRDAEVSLSTDLLVWQS